GVLELDALHGMVGSDPDVESSEGAEGSAAVHADGGVVAAEDEHAAGVVGAASSRQSALREAILFRRYRLFLSEGVCGADPGVLRCRCPLCRAWKGDLR